MSDRIITVTSGAGKDFSKIEMLESEFMKTLGAAEKKTEVGDLSKLVKADLLEIAGADADESMTKAEIIELIQGK